MKLNELFTGPHAKTLREFYLAWYAQAQTVLREFYQVFTPDLFMGTVGQDELTDLLRLIALAADNQIDEPETVLEAINTILQAKPPLTPQMRWVLVMAQTKAAGDELITPSQAAEICQISLPAINQALNRGKLTRHIDPNEANPQHQTRLSRLEVEGWAG